MQEFHDLKVGEIYSDCQCTVDQLQNVDKFRPIIDDMCYKPNASDCTWYDRCFIKRYSNCTTSEQQSSNANNMLSVDFSKRFCSLLDQNRSYLSDYARQWMDQVRQCLMDKTAPLIRPWQNEQCDKLESEVMNFLSPCFIKPVLRLDTSICQLDCKSWWLLFRDIKSFFTTGTYQSNRIIKQFFKFGVKGTFI